MGRHEQNYHPPQPNPAADALEEALLRQTVMGRRQALKLAFLAGTTFAGAIACTPPSTPQPPRSQRELGITPPTPEPTVSANDQILQREIRRLGIKEDPQEKQRWQTRGFSRSEIPLPIDPTTQPEAARRVATTINLMAESSNKYISERATFFNESKDTFYTFQSKARLDNRAMASRIEAKNGKIIYYIDILPDFVLNLANTTILAAALTHEIEHIRNMKNSIDSLPATMSAEEKYRRYDAFSAQDTEQINEESRGYGAESQALIHQRGLLGYNDFAGTPAEEWAVQFIRSGNNIESPEWKTYIKRLLIR